MAQPLASGGPRRAAAFLPLLLTALAPDRAARAQQPSILDLCILGTRRELPLPIAGFVGQLEAEPLALVTRQQLAAAVAAGLVLHDSVVVQQLAERRAGLGFGPLRSVPSLLDGDLELDAAVRLTAASDEGSLNRPVASRATMSLRSEPAHTVFTRHIRFRDHEGADRFLALEFRRDHDLRFSATLPDGLTVLEDLVDTGERSHWDQLALVNRGGTTALEIARFELEIDYDVDDFLRSPTTTRITIPLVDRRIDAVLGAGEAVLPLSDFARATRRAFAGVDSSSPGCVLLAIDDLGKSGSDGGSGPNPKYGGRIDLLCSEFVSWYYHQSGVSILGFAEEFKDITGTQQLHDLFRSARRLYRYDSGSSARRFEDPDTGAVYTPRAGDFLEWRKNGSAMHSMMLLSYDEATKVARVVNGPWPVRLMDVDLQWWEELSSNEHDFWVGAIPR